MYTYCSEFTGRHYYNIVWGCVSIFAQTQICSESGPEAALLLERFLDEQEPKKEVTCESSSISPNNSPETDSPEYSANYPVRPYTSVPDLTWQNSSSTPEQSNSRPELKNTINSHHSATNMNIKTKVSYKSTGMATLLLHCF